jgi:hypothetical protein
MQQIVVAVQVVELAGPHTCPAPLPLQQYGEPEVHRFWAMGFCEGQLEGGVTLFPRLGESGMG